MFGSTADQAQEVARCLRQKHDGKGRRLQEVRELGVLVLCMLVYSVLSRRLAVEELVQRHTKNNGEMRVYKVDKATLEKMSGKRPHQVSAMCLSCIRVEQTFIPPKRE